MIEYVLADVPYDELYWQKLMEEGEQSLQPAPP